MQKLPRVEENMSPDEQLKILYNWCFVLSQELTKDEEESLYERKIESPAG